MRRLLAALAAAALVLGGCGPGRVVRHGQVNEDALAVVRDELPAVRGLAFRAPVPASAVDREALRATLSAELDRSYHPGDLERLEAVMKRLGLLPQETSLRSALQRIYEQEGAGFYDPRSKRLILATHALDVGGWWVNVLTTITRRDLVGEMLVAHELTHALQDQHWGVPADPEPVTDAHGDRQLARRALLEGDATLSGFAYVVGKPLDRGWTDWLTRRLHGTADELRARYPDVPEAVRATVAFQYDEGTAFAAHAFTHGGWPAVDGAEARPPTSTEQVLHPLRYFNGQRDEPIEIALGGTEGLERDGWTRVLEDTLGELDVRLLAGRFLPAPRAASVADGWGGDRLRALARGDELVLVWMTAWDAPADAAEFAAAVPEIVPEARVDERATRVLVLLGPAAGPRVDLEALAAAVWRRS